jgi:ApbE superfamily uncharacterized protein (UPF0280 family)
MSGPYLVRLAGDRLHFQHGPIDLIVSADGPFEAVEAAYAKGWRRFEHILDELVAELPLLRAPLGAEPPPLRGRTARRMLTAVWPFRERYVTPMAAVAGAVAEEILEAMTPAIPLLRAMVNNGGDIALYLLKDEKIVIGVSDDPALAELAGTVTVRAGDPVRGIATSGWRGRSQSLGIADAVTVLARRAAQADAAATMIANAINADHPAIERRPANEVKDDSDLGDLLVTVAVGALPYDVVIAALDAGESEARLMQAAGLIHGAVLLLQGEVRVIGERTQLLGHDIRLVQ